MSAPFNLLEWGPLSTIRRNHGLEHATINLLSQRHPGLALAGHSDTKGFWLIGAVSTEELVETVKEALERMNAGERGLAIHAHCGTNAATTGVVAGSLAWLAMLNTGNNWKKKLDRWPLVVLLATAGVIVSQPLGPLVQEKVTTSGLPGGLRVTCITRHEPAGTDGAVMHRIETADSELIAE